MKQTKLLLGLGALAVLLAGAYIYLNQGEEVDTSDGEVVTQTTDGEVIVVESVASKKMTTPSLTRKFSDDLDAKDEGSDPMGNEPEVLEIGRPDFVAKNATLELDPDKGVLTIKVVIGNEGDIPGTMGQYYLEIITYSQNGDDDGGGSTYPYPGELKDGSSTLVTKRVNVSQAFVDEVLAGEKNKVWIMMNIDEKGESHDSDTSNNSIADFFYVSDENLTNG